MSYTVYAVSKVCYLPALRALLDFKTPWIQHFESTSMYKNRTLDELDPRRLDDKFVKPRDRRYPSLFACDPLRLEEETEDA